MASTASAAKPPYAQAIALIRQVTAGADSDLINGEALNPATEEFLNRNVAILDLLRQGAIIQSTQWEPDTSDFRELESQILAVGDLCKLCELSAQTKLAVGRPTDARDDVLCAMALIRNITRGLPFRYVKSIELGNEVFLLWRVAELTPSLPPDQVRQMSAALEQLPAAVSPGEAICGDPQFHAIQFARRALPPAQLREALDSFSLFCKAAAKEIEREPALSQEEFEQRVAELAKNIGPDAPRVARTLAEISVKAIAHFHASVCNHREWTGMFHCGLDIIREGPSDVQKCLESHGNGSFTYVPVDRGFAIQAKTISPCTGKPIALRFGQAVRNQT